MDPKRLKPFEYQVLSGRPEDTIAKSVGDIIGPAGLCPWTVNAASTMKHLKAGELLGQLKRPAAQSEATKMAEGYSKKETDQALRIQQLEANANLAGVEQRLDTRLNGLESKIDQAVARIEAAISQNDLKWAERFNTMDEKVAGQLRVIDAKYDERSKGLDWKFNFIAGGILAIIIGTFVMPYLKAETAIGPVPPPVIINVPPAPTPALAPTPARPPGR